MEDKKFYVYRYRIKNTKETIYIGKGSGRRYLRTDKRNKFFKDVLATHDCEVQILQSGLSEQEAFNFEKLLIRYYRNFTNDRLTNVCDGGEGVSGHRWTEEEHAIGLRNTGVKNPNYGNKWSEEKKKRFEPKTKSNSTIRRE